MDIRIISATHRNLEEDAREGKFREDLYYRLNVVTINVPPLRDRREDIPLLANHFLHKFTMANSKKINGISGEAMKMLIGYHWPGNIRELENVIERAVVVSKTDEIIPNDLTEVVQKGLKESTPRTLDESEKSHISRILEDNDWNISKSAAELSIDRATLYSKIKKYKIEK